MIIFSNDYTYSQKDSTSIDLLNFFYVIEKYENDSITGNVALVDLNNLKPSLLDQIHRINEIVLNRKNDPTTQVVSDSVLTSTFYDSSIGFCYMLYILDSYYELFINSKGESFLITSYENPSILTIKRLMSDKDIIVTIKNNAIFSYTIHDKFLGIVKTVSKRDSG
jgi:hypothetical protein